MPSLLDLGDHVAADLLQPSDREILVRLDQVNQVVGNHRLLCRGGLGRADVHPPIDAHGVSHDDLDVSECFGDGQR